MIPAPPRRRPRRQLIAPLWRERLALAAFHWLGRQVLRRFEWNLTQAQRINERALRELLSRNAATAFGRTHDLAGLSSSADLQAAFATRVPLSTYLDYEPYVARIEAGEAAVLTADAVHMLAGSSGTTDRPKRIPRTRRAQRHHLRLVVLAEQAVIDRELAGTPDGGRGINLMSLHNAGDDSIGAVPVMSGPNAGMARLRRLIPLLWCAPTPVYGVADPASALYLHALFALQYPAAGYIETPFAPQVTAWFALIERHQASLVRDVRDGTLLAPHLLLTHEDRASLVPLLSPNPARAAELAKCFSLGFEGIVPRLWPTMRYLRTVTTGSFGLSMPRLRWLAGPVLPIHSGCHSSSEGVIGINLKADGSTDYVLAVGTAYFEFIRLNDTGQLQPATVTLADVVVGGEYEIVLTSCAGLYRYRLGDIVRITGRVGQAPTFEYLYRRGTLLNLVGEKTSECHTARAVTYTIDRWLGRPGLVKDYTVAGRFQGGRGRYTFFVELSDTAPRTIPRRELEQELDDVLGELNPYYRTSGRHTERLDPPELIIVRPGTFDDLLTLQLRRAAPATASQIKVPRLVTSTEQLLLLEEHALTTSQLDTATG